MKVVNLLGGPCSGKSTIASYLFFKLKKLDIKVELAPEYAKDVVYETKSNILDQLYIFAKQRQRLQRLIGNDIDVVITDSPLILTCLYALLKNSSPSEYFCPLVKDIFSSFDNLNIFINRDSEEYSTLGRVETKEEAIEADIFFKQKLQEWNIPFTEFSRNHPDKILDHVLNNISY